MYELGVGISIVKFSSTPLVESIVQFFFSYSVAEVPPIHASLGLA